MTVANEADAFANGLQAAGVAACAKHFPGVGALTEDTDFALREVDSSQWELDAALVPFETEIRDGVDMIMVASAIYPRYDSSAPAGFSQKVIKGLLRRRLGFTGVVISDALDSPAALPGDIGQRAVSAAQAGADLVLFKPAEDGSITYDALLSATHAGTLDVHAVGRSYRRILLLKRRVEQQVGARQNAQ